MINKIKISLILLIYKINSQYDYTVYNSVNLKYWEAKNFCISKGLEIAKIESEEQNNALYQAAKDANCEDKWTWIGLERESKYSSVWKWSDGSEANYLNWFKNEPHNTGEENVFFKGGKWADLKGKHKLKCVACYTQLQEPTVDWVAQCYQNRSTNLADENLQNCLVTADFGTAKECYKCENGYTYDEKYHCITLADAEEQGVCTSLTGVPVGTDECSYCDGGKGNTCAEGTVLVSDGSCVTAIANCDNYDCDGKCLECLNGYYLAQDANVCVAKIDHCVDYESSGECLNCQSGYIEVADDKCCPEILNCKVYNADTCGVCDQICKTGETEQNDICHVIIPHCENYNDDSTCNFCENGYQVAVDDDKVCVPEAPHCVGYYANENCATCAIDYIIVSDHTMGLDKCVPVIDHCEEYDYSTGQCHDCAAAYELAYDDDVCVPVIPNCGVYQSDGECYKCVAGYLGLSPTSCHENIPECIRYGCSGACDTCAYGYVVLNGSCSPVIPYCQDYSSNGDCATCTSGYHSQDHECHDNKHCASYNCDGTCVKCADGHTLTEYGVCTDTAN